MFVFEPGIYESELIVPSVPDERNRDGSHPEVLSECGEVDMAK